MSSVGIFRANKPEIVGVQFDLRISESHDLNATPTQFPVEGTAEDIVEHIILNPRVVSIEAYMSNIDDDNRALGENARNALAELDKIRVERLPLDLITEHIAYNNMVLTSISAGHPGSGPTDRGSMTYELTFQQVIILNTNTILVPAEQLNDAPGTSKGQAVNKSASSEINAGVKDGAILAEGTSLAEAIA